MENTETEEDNAIKTPDDLVKATFEVFRDAVFVTCIAHKRQKFFRSTVHALEPDMAEWVAGELKLVLEGDTQEGVQELFDTLLQQIVFTSRDRTEAWLESRGAIQ